MNNLYTEINNSFKKKLVYHLGSEAGFFSEYNNMILAMLYCLQNNIMFELFSKDANFGTLKGWEDYFEPFCIESSNLYHIRYNHRHPQKLSFKIKTFTFFLKLISKTHYLTYEIWPKFRNNFFYSSNFDIPKLFIQGDINSSARKLLDITWKYNRQTSNEINQLIYSLNLPKKYIGMHIRGGDKFIEWEKVEIEKYMNIIVQKTSLYDIFVLTDDYRIITELNEKYSDYKFYTLCNKNELGYYHDNFSHKCGAEKRNDMIKLFASMDILSNSDLFVGTYSSNPGMYLGMRMDKEKVIGVDLEKWCVW